jgi:hypothetical protein
MVVISLRMVTTSETRSVLVATASMLPGP